MHRPTVGLIAVILLGGALALWLWPRDWGCYQALLGACLRLGAVMAALWLAHPQLRRLPPWLADGLLVTVLLVALRPKLLLLAVPLLVAFWLLRPRS